MPNIIEISDFLSPNLDVFARLTEAQLRSRFEPEKGIFIAESPKVIGFALDAGCESVSLLMERKHIAGQQAHDIITRCGDIPVYTADSNLLAGLTGFKLTRGVLCAMPCAVPSCPALKSCVPVHVEWLYWKISWILPTSVPFFAQLRH